jgi:hypothetical protein
MIVVLATTFLEVVVALVVQHDWTHVPHTHEKHVNYYLIKGKLGCKNIVRTFNFKTMKLGNYPFTKT